MTEQIFISHTSADNQVAFSLYDHLLNARYWVWMDKKDLRAGEKWPAQLDENLRKSTKLIVLFSSESIKSDWVKHEGSMASALNQTIIPVNIEPSRSYLSRDLALWAREIQLYELYEGSADYADQLELVKRRLGHPLPIRQHLLEMLRHYQESKVLLDEGSLDLIERHYGELHLSAAQKRIADELIRESKLKLESYWIRYDKLNKAYKTARTEGLELKQVVRSLHADKMLRQFLLVLFAAAWIAELILVTYFFYQLWLQSNL